jgi:hypothetical protein
MIVWSSFMRWADISLIGTQSRYLSADCQGSHDATGSASLLHMLRQDTARRGVSTVWRLLPTFPPSNRRGFWQTPNASLRIMTVQNPMSLRQLERGSLCRHEKDHINGQSTQREHGARRPGDWQHQSCTYPVVPPPCFSCPDVVA